MRQTERQVFNKALLAMADFKNTFGRNLSPDFIAELYVADHLDLEINEEVNQPGYDAIGTKGERFQIKYRSKDTP